MTPEHKARFESFIRNERWGTCVDCPRDDAGIIRPEYCENTGRYDHHLDVNQMVEGYSRQKRYDAWQKDKITNQVMR
jgi:hypothetical protein